MIRKFSRYERQYILKEIGREGQARLDRASVAVVGIGALGTVSADLLARAGIGRLKLIDRDFLEMNNLQRQVLFDEKDLADNLPKAVAAQRKLERVNSEIRISSETADVNAGTIHELLDGTDLIVDGTDNFETRFLLNDYA
ncbi:MAG: ThiF family adenylyltransferase, partial [Candidatus Omnitrophota bacterium]